MSGRARRAWSSAPRPRGRRLARVLGLAAVAALAAACQSGGGAEEAPRSPRPPAVGEMLPAYAAPTPPGTARVPGPRDGVSYG